MHVSSTRCSAAPRLRSGGRWSSSSQRMIKGARRARSTDDTSSASKPRRTTRCPRLRPRSRCRRRHRRHHRCPRHRLPHHRSTARRTRCAGALESRGAEGPHCWCLHQRSLRTPSQSATKASASWRRASWALSPFGASALLRQVQTVTEAFSLVGVEHEHSAAVFDDTFSRGRRKGVGVLVLIIVELES